MDKTGESLNQDLHIRVFRLLMYYTEAVTQKGFIIKGILRNFAKFTGRHPCQSLFFNKVAGQRRNLRNF